MKLISHYFESVAGVEIYPILSFLIFFSFFLIVTFITFRMRKEQIEELSKMPLDNDTIAETEMNH